jgi:hypothetical protein
MEILYVLGDCFITPAPKQEEAISLNDFRAIFSTAPSGC